MVVVILLALMLAAVSCTSDPVPAAAEADSAEVDVAVVDEVAVADLMVDGGPDAPVAVTFLPDPPTGVVGRDRGRWVTLVEDRSISRWRLAAFEVASGRRLWDQEVRTCRTETVTVDNQPPTAATPTTRSSPRSKPTSTDTSTADPSTTAPAQDGLLRASGVGRAGG